MKKKKNTPFYPKIKSGVFRTIRRGSPSVGLKKNLLCTVVTYLQSMLQKYEKIAVYCIGMLREFIDILIFFSVIVQKVQAVVYMTRSIHEAENSLTS